MSLNVTFAFWFLLPTTVFATEVLDSQSKSKLYFYEELFWDRDFSPQASASTITYPFHYVSRALEQHSLKLTDEAPIGPAKRLLHGFLIEFPTTFFATIVQHEFSHGFRMREANCDPTYHFGLPPPYSVLNPNQRNFGEAACFDRPTTVKANQLIELGGHEGNEVYSHHIRSVLFSNESLDRSLLNLYAINRLELLAYQNKDENAPEGIEGVSDQKSVKRKALINLLDPLIWSAISKNIAFIQHGTTSETSNFFDQWLFYPSASYKLIPFGESYEIGTYSILKDHLWMINLSRWNFSSYYDPSVKKDGYHVSIATDSLMRRLRQNGYGYRINLQAAREPYFVTDSWDGYSNVFSMELALRIMTAPSDLGYLVGVRLKNKGYLPGMPLAASPQVFAGIIIGQL